jgi:hypothetical protein
MRVPSARRLLGSVMLLAVCGADCGVRPSGVITGGPAPTGGVMVRVPGPVADDTVLFLVRDAELEPVARRTRGPLAPTRALVLLQGGPNRDERARNLTSEVSPGLDPATVTIDVSGATEVAVSADVAELSATAVDQIVCTVAAALSTDAPVTVTGGTASRGPRTCSLAG